MSSTTPPSDPPAPDESSRPRFRLRREIPQAPAKPTNTGGTVNLERWDSTDGSRTRQSLVSNLTIAGTIGSSDAPVTAVAATRADAALAEDIAFRLGRHTLLGTLTSHAGPTPRGSMEAQVVDMGVSTLRADEVFRTLAGTMAGRPPSWGRGDQIIGVDYARTPDREGSWVRQLINQVRAGAPQIMVEPYTLDWAYALGHELHSRLGYLYTPLPTFAEPLRNCAVRCCRLPCSRGLVIALQFEDPGHDYVRDLTRHFHTMALSGTFVEGALTEFHEYRVACDLTLEAIEDLSRRDSSAQSALQTGPLRTACVEAMRECLLSDLRGE